MKKRHGILLLGLLCMSCFQVRAADSNSITTPPQESWQVISNRWGTSSIEKITQAADNSDVSAQYYLAIAYANGNGIAQDESEAFKWMQLAAKQGMARAQRKVGWMLQNGTGTPENILEAVDWYQKSAGQGDKFASENLAWIYARGAYGATNGFGQGADAQIRSGGIAPDHELAEKWMRRAVDVGSPEGQYEFGDLLFGEFDNDGHQDETRFPEAAKWLTKSAEQGYAKAQYELAEMYHYGKLGDDQRSNCIPWYVKAAAQGNADAQSAVANLRQYYPNSDLLKSINPVDSLKQAAGQDDLNAEFDLAWRYHHGDGVPKDDVEAFKWMQKAAQHDISPVTRTIDAHYYLGVMYEKGEGVTNDLKKANDLFQQAAVGGNKPDPLVCLGQMYERGEGVPQDDRQAAENYWQATQFGFFPTSDDTARCTAIEGLFNLYFQGRGLPDDKAAVELQLNEIKKTPIRTAKGQFLLGQIYAQGKFVPPDLVEADAWLRLAAAKKFEGAQSSLDQVELKISPAQKDDAKKRFEALDENIKQTEIFYEQNESYRLSHSW